jgi:hypothetical protein
MSPRSVEEHALRERDVLGLGRRALEAWGRFAATRDLSLVEGLFAAGGPQLRAFREQAAAATPAPGYRFALPEAEVLEVGAGERILRGEVVVTAPEGRRQRLDWDISVRRGDDGTWRVWGVRSTPPV